MRGMVWDQSSQSFNDHLVWCKCGRVIDLLFAEKISEVRNGVLAISHKLRFCLRAVIFFTFYI